MILLIAGLLAFILFTTINVISMPTLKQTDHSLKGKVSILIPMRNEEENAAGIINSIKSIQYPEIEVLVLNDKSTDRTEECLQRAINGDQRFSVYEGSELPKGWVGKVHACKQLGKRAKGEYLLFLDADVRVEPNVVHQAMHVMERYNSKLVTGFPKFPIRPFIGRLLVPLQHFFIFFHLPNIIGNTTVIPAFTAAHGAFMFFEKKAYDAIGGHAAVKDSLIEDIHITRTMKRHGFKATLANVTPSVSCFMYDTNKDVWEGFLKNIYVGLGRSPVTALLVSIFYLSFYFLPLIIAILSIWTLEWHWIIPLLLVWVQTAIIDRAAKQAPFHFLLMPLSAVALTILLGASMLRSIFKKGYVWKGRIYK
ncbi:glycosyltransferase [Jeotgalibacillus sp. S-D1]|uniref:glycosyltransferase n=1 Tax=Jeotgalibacillus sp. S-D1 TaxID=2552189 RepID=UPI00105963FC|nr:glycosyltransferase family 2 protein [Jeotgalibacillus sp. S-D1]TDL34824.1 glycosyltransferase [Jeotgalibacillus sp. S-D1]